MSTKIENVVYRATGARQIRCTRFFEGTCRERLGPSHRVAAPERESRPMESHREPLAEPDMNLSAHPAPIKQTLRSYRYPSVRRVPDQMFFHAASELRDGFEQISETSRPHHSRVLDLVVDVTLLVPKHRSFRPNRTGPLSSSSSRAQRAEAA
jgi:hypothetical protein